VDLAEEIQRLVNHLRLRPHPEGGFYAETYRSTDEMIPEWTGSHRSVSTAIYFLLTAGIFSAFHRIRSDELWHHYMGGTAEIHVFDPGGDYSIIRLGTDITNGEVPQALVPAGSWFASRVSPGVSYVLAGCTVAPGFDFADFEMAERDQLIQQYPRYEDIIRKMTR